MRDEFARMFGMRVKEILSLEANRERIGDLAYTEYKKSFGCSQSILFAFQEVLGLKDDFGFKALGALQGGGSCGLTCGALMTGFIILGTKVGRNNVEEGFFGTIPALEPSQKLFQWFKAQYKTTVCSEIKGVDWFDLNSVVAHYTGPEGMDTIEKCAKLTGGTAYKVAEMLSKIE
jgi:hypothetical protein